MPSPEAKTVEDQVVTLTDADTEYSLAISGNVEAIEIQPRTDVAVRHSFVTGKVATPTDPYNTIKSGFSYYKEHIRVSSPTLYLASSTAGTKVEVRIWR
ncbi:hypothetical protein Pan258_01980 [Symmachiella dynata]|uniref:hypothetical protein n=1 Tax=Symmachiella dynata TaxID=2527995 RepID=UPI00118C7794|nr:hypothetical protein [Symmachiella dynata]QDT46181.1 hypothetical protein Pan258_01980 [Symmachiella dynata]